MHLMKTMLALVQIGLLLVACGGTESDCIELLDSHALQFPTYHVQGLAVTEDAYYVSAVDREGEQGWLFRVDRDSLSLQATARCPCRDTVMAWMLRLGAV